MPMEIYDQNAVHSSPVDFVSSSIDIVDYVEDILRRHSSLELSLFAKLPDCDDAASFCSILTDKLQYCQSDTSDSVRYFSNDSFKAIIIIIIVYSIYALTLFIVIYSLHIIHVYMRDVI